jgi:hypothetical protein
MYGASLTALQSWFSMTIKKTVWIGGDLTAVGVGASAATGADGNVNNARPRPDNSNNVLAIMGDGFPAGLIGLSLACIIVFLHFISIASYAYDVTYGIIFFEGVLVKGDLWKIGSMAYPQMSHEDVPIEPKVMYSNERIAKQRAVLFYPVTVNGT